MSDPESGGLKRSDSRRSPTTGHRRRNKDQAKRSHSMEARKATGERLTSSEEELVGKCLEIVEQARRVQQSNKLTKRKPKRDPSQPPKEERKEEDSGGEEEGQPTTPWWKRLFSKKEKEPDKKEEKQLIVYEKKEEKPKPVKVPGEPLQLREFIRVLYADFKKYKVQYAREVVRIKKLRNRCLSELLIMFIFCGSGAFVFKTTEGTFETFYKCGVKRVKRDFVEELWRGSHHLQEDEWKSRARRKLMEFENQLQDAFEAGMKSYSGQRSWSFLNALFYCLTVVTTIGYGHLAPVTTTGRALTIAYSIIGIPLFLILLADFGKLFTRSIKFVWAFVRRFYYTGTCRKARRSAPVQLAQDEEEEPVDLVPINSCESDDSEEVMKGVQIMYDLAHLRRPSQVPEGGMGGPDLVTPTSPENPPTPALSAFAIDDEFNLPISVAIFILLIYIFLGALVFWFWEDDWTFFESFYFVFISMSTIGFGDLVPQNQMYMMASIVYLAFGLALTSMCINVVQEKLSDTFRQASAKIGATIGLKVAEDDGTISPVSPTQVEVAQVHKSHVAPQS